MKTYTVRLRRTTVETAETTIEAASADDAWELAEGLDDDSLPWEPDLGDGREGQQTEVVDVKED
jgi:hypothetical protein